MPAVWYGLSSTRRILKKHLLIHPLARGQVNTDAGPVLAELAQLELPGIALWIFAKYEITKDVHSENLVELGYVDGVDERS